MIDGVAAARAPARLPCAAISLLMRVRAERAAVPRGRRRWRIQCVQRERSGSTRARAARDAALFGDGYAMAFILLTVISAAMLLLIR